MSAPSPEQLLRNIKTPEPAPVHLWDPPFCGDMDMKIARDGTWIHQGQPIRRLAMVQLFASVLMLEDDEYYLVTPVEKVRIQVEDCPFVATEMDMLMEDGNQRLRFTTNTGEIVYAGVEHELCVDTDPVSGEPHPTIHVRSGLKALLSRSVFYRLVNEAEQREAGDEILIRVKSDGCIFELGRHPAAD